MRVNSTGVKGEDDVVGFRPPAPGRYHVVVKHVDDTFQKVDGLRVEFEVLAGTVPGQEGLTVTETMFLRDGASTDQHLRFALVAGLIQPGTEADVNFQHAVGRQMVIGLEKKKSKKDDKEYTNIAEYGMAIWAMNNPAVSDVPKLPPPGHGNGQATPAPMPQYQSPPPAQYQQPPQQQYAPPAAQQAPQQPTQQPAPQQSGGWSDI